MNKYHLSINKENDINKENEKCTTISIVIEAETIYEAIKTANERHPDCKINLEYIEDPT